MCISRLVTHIEQMWTFFNPVIHKVCILCTVAFVYSFAVFAPHIGCLTWSCLFLLYIMSIWSFLFRPAHTGACSVPCHLEIEGLIEFLFHRRSSSAFHSTSATVPEYSYMSCFQLPQVCQHHSIAEFPPLTPLWCQLQI